MSDAFGGRPFPKGVLIAVAALLSFTIVMIAIARLTGTMLDQAPVTAEVLGRDVKFVDLEDGSLGVYDVSTDALIKTLPPGGEGFIRGLLRSMARERKAQDTPMTSPFHLAWRESGHLTLEDPSTGILMDLRAFGETNEGAFAELMPSPPGHPSPPKE